MTKSRDDSRHDPQSAGLTRRALMTSSLAAGAVLGLGGPASLLGSSAQAAEPKRGGILKIGVNGGAATDPVDPAVIASSPTRLVTRQWGDTLVEVTPDRKAVGLLAESFSSNADGTEWTFNIRQGVTFHDGSELTAEDVVATYKRHSDEASQSAVMPLMKGITEMKADGSKVVLRLATANADLPYLLSDYHLPIQPRGGVDAPGATIGTGPYKVVSIEPGIRYVLEKNQEDWNRDRGYYDGLEMLVINDSMARTSALQSGQIHMANYIDPKVAKFLVAAPGIKVTQTPSRAHYCFEAMIDKQPFGSKDLILALKYALNRQEMLDKILGGFGSIGNDIPINSAYPLFEEKLEQRLFDLAKAAEHYKASGHDGSPIELHVAEIFPGAVDMAMLWQASCAQAGIPLAVKRVPEDGYWTQVWLFQPFVADYLLGRPVQDQLYSMFFQAGAEWNASHFANADFDALLLQARGELDETKRKELYGKMARILWEEAAVFIPVFADFVNAHSDKIAGWTSNPNDELMGGFAPSRTWFA
ncbi:ABC transporter substrate-binding protein [Mesorhizobium sp. LHD-90]|uniref:ABC transporter substrate-binding protein n=1 Tax=Mesorhizobium sp. LHD-90 TaxID=3071414 RepID=UPI0027E1E508|nr:ABC transporter substrate-binding protein [Mesorhizobium sp. LHD-90]MDQ6433220.1 ABC transporter substrate-binding protein [Mesorhizobium sp. LHD-90]